MEENESSDIIPAEDIIGVFSIMAGEEMELRQKILDILPDLKNKDQIAESLLTVVFDYAKRDVVYRNIFDNVIAILATASKRKIKESKVPNSISFREEDKKVCYYDDLYTAMPRYLFKDKGDYYRAVFRIGAFITNIIIVSQVESGEININSFTIPEPLKSLKALKESQDKFVEALKAEFAIDLARDYGDAMRMKEKMDESGKGMINTLLDAMEIRQNVYQFSSMAPGKLGLPST
jgi:hypothetical protein